MHHATVRAIHRAAETLRVPFDCHEIDVAIIGHRITITAFRLRRGIDGHLFREDVLSALIRQTPSGRWYAVGYEPLRYHPTPQAAIRSIMVDFHIAMQDQRATQEDRA